MVTKKDLFLWVLSSFGLKALSPSSVHVVRTILWKPSLCNHLSERKKKKKKKKKTKNDDDDENDDFDDDDGDTVLDDDVFSFVVVLFSEGDDGCKWRSFVVGTIFVPAG